MRCNLIPSLDRSLNPKSQSCFLLLVPQLKSCCFSAQLATNLTLDWLVGDLIVFACAHSWQANAFSRCSSYSFSADATIELPSLVALGWPAKVSQLGARAETCCGPSESPFLRKDPACSDGATQINLSRAFQFQRAQKRSQIEPPWQRRLQWL